MAKIRGVKPEFWTDERVVEVSRDARLLFIGMWNFACDNGHLDDKPKQLKMKIFPGDSDTNLDAWLDELVTAGRIIRDGTTITIPKFAEHQKPHKRWWTTCDLPLCVVPDSAAQHGNNRGATVVKPGKTVAQPYEVDCEVDCDGEGDTSAASPTVEKDDRFDDFYKPYPRHEAVGDARKAWKAAVKKTDPDTIIAGLVAQLPEMSKRDRQFIKLPASWLRAECWLNEATQADADPYAHLTRPTTDWDAVRAEAAASRGGGAS